MFSKEGAMGELKRYRCNSCGHRFEVEVLTREERLDAEREGRPVYAISCPECRRTDVRPGWD